MDHISSVSQSLQLRLLTQREQCSPPEPLRQPGQCKPDCPVCGGVGFVRLDVPPGDYRFGKLQPCPHLPKKDVEGRYGLLLEEQGYTWERIKRSDHSVAEALAQTQLITARGYGWLYLWGGYGTAKTLLLKIAVAEALRAEREAIYIRMVDLLDDLRAAYDCDNSMAELVARVRHWVNIPLLAIDEIDRFKQTAWTDERFFQLLDRRYDGAEVRRTATLIASNKSPAEMDSYFTSRVRDGRFSVIQMAGPDMRPAMEYPVDRTDVSEILRQEQQEVWRQE